MIDAKLRAAAAALCVAGIGVAGYLTWIHYADLDTLCVGGGGGCERVQSSDYAELAGVPVSLLGLIGYVTIGAALIVGGERGRLAAAFLALVGFGFSVYLTYVELFVLEAVCQWCVASAVLMTGLAIVTVARVLRE